MMDRKSVRKIAESYGKKGPAVAAVASHSALDVFEGAAAEGLPTLAICQKGRERTYTGYFRTRKGAFGAPTVGFIDDAVVLGKFAALLDEKNQSLMRKRRAVLIPNRALTSYLPVEAVENDLKVPLFGSRSLLASEERGSEGDYYSLLAKAGLPYPERVERPEDISGLVIVKLPHAVKRLERGFFTAASRREFREKSGALLKDGVITENDLASARIERYIIGPVFNLDFFHSPLAQEGDGLELLGIDWRFETSLDGHVRLPATQQLTLGGRQAIPEYTVCGHNSATLRESLLEKAFELGERYVAAAREHYPPGIIGPFCLQTCVDRDLNFYIYDVAPRVGGGTNIHMAVGHPYGNALWRMPMSTGRRIAMEIRRAVEEGRLGEVVT